MDRFAKIVNGFAKRLILDVWQGSEYSFEFPADSATFTEESLMEDFIFCAVYSIKESPLTNSPLISLVNNLCYCQK